MALPNLNNSIGVAVIRRNPNTGQEWLVGWIENGRDWLSCDVPAGTWEFRIAVILGSGQTRVTHYGYTANWPAEIIAIVGKR